MVEYSKESVHCYKCKGSGLYGVLDATTGLKRVKNCKKCKGIGRVWANIGSREWELGRKVIFELGNRVKYRE